MVFLRGHPLDYQRWVQQGAEGWSYAAVLPYFKRLEHHERGADFYRGGEGYFHGDWHPRHDQEGYLLGAGPMRPSSRGQLRLASSDPSMAPEIDPNYLATPEDRAEIYAGFELMRETLRQPAFERFDAGETDPGPAVRAKEEIEAYIRRAARSAYHPCGTCKMGADHDASAVVDSHGRVRGVESLRIVDASIMPSVVSSNTNAVVMMIAEKLCDAILGKPPLPPADVRLL